jgi:GNAT superfamily N-acetyltransferase
VRCGISTALCSGRTTEAGQVPWVIRDVVKDVNQAVGRRWADLDPLLPEPGELPEGCMAPLVAEGHNGRPAGLAVCRHQHIPADSLLQTWGTATRFVLTPRLRESDTLAAADQLLAQWREHLAGLPEAHEDDTSAVITWPSRDISGVRALLRHGMQPMAVLAVRPAGRPVPAPGPETGLTIREAGPDDLDAVADLEMGVIRYDAYFGGSIPRPATQALTREGSRVSLQQRPSWTWLAERAGEAVGLLTVQPPKDAAWIAGMTRRAPAAYLQSMFVRPQQRGAGVSAALVERAHAALDAHGVAVTLLHYSQVNPRSAPFWSRMGYRPLWTSWEARPAATLR